MIVETVAVGTELLIGQIVNGNAATIGAALGEQGFDAHHQQVVGDNLGRIGAVLATAMGRADAVIVTGGIGPTQDDITREAICLATGLEMDHSETYENALRERWETLGRIMPVSNLRQADHPRGAELLPNPKGSAPGLFLEHEGVMLFALPGVPEEMEYLLAAEVLPRLRRASEVQETLVSRVLRTWGTSESQVADTLDDLYVPTNPSLAFLVTSGEIKIRISAKAADPATAREMIGPVEQEIRRRLGPAVFAADDETIESVITDLLLARGWTIGTAESITSGEVAARLSRLPGSSRVFRGGVVTYAADLKESLLDVTDVSAGVVSEETALAMAQGGRGLLRADVVTALTGSAGPDPLEKAVGTVVIAVVTPEGARARTLSLPGDRERVRAYGVTAALNLTRLAISGVWWT